VEKQERLQAAIDREIVDRPPVALWRHFPVDDQEPLNLAQAIIQFQEEYDFDFVKITPASSFCLRDWGVEDEWRANPEGTREYTHHPVLRSEDWRSIHALPPDGGSLGRQLECLSLLESSLYPHTPYIQTIFSPLSQAKNLCGKENLMVWIHKDPALVKQALEVITQTTIAFIEKCQEHRISGIFYAVQHASYRYFDWGGYAEFGEPYDARILEAANELWLNVLHLHGVDLMFELADRLNIQVVNWHDQETAPSLADGKRDFRGAVLGGLARQKSMVLGDPWRINQEAKKAIRSTDEGRGLILGTGCVVPIIVPRSNLLAARMAVESQ
jgi:uroporphyrinogen decarboxylase